MNLPLLSVVQHCFSDDLKNQPLDSISQITRCTNAVLEIQVSQITRCTNAVLEIQVRLRGVIISNNVITKMCC